LYPEIRLHKDLRLIAVPTGPHYDPTASPSTLQRVEACPALKPPPPAAWAACRAPVLAARRLRRSAPCHLKKNKRTEEVKIEEAKKGMELQNF